MLSIFDIVPQPTESERIIDIIDPAAKSEPWVLGYVLVGVLICVAVFVVIRLMNKSKK